MSATPFARPATRSNSFQLRGTWLAGLALASVATGAIVHSTSFIRWAPVIWMTGLIVSGAPLLWGSVRAVSQRRFAADLVASLSIIGAIAFSQPLAGLIIVIMQSGGEALERYAEGRASDAVRALEERAPSIAHRRTPQGEAEIPVGQIVIGDELLIRPGEMVPCDGVVLDGHSHLDTSSITGESLPVPAGPGTPVASGYLNQDRPFLVRATAPAGTSQYARIVELVRSAQASKAPIQRLADRYAAWFTPLTLAACAAAWFISRDPTRVLAVLVVATPCPLLLAAPVAILGGINRGARRGVLFLHGSALEQLTRIDTVVVDKTGTLTVGEPAVARIRPAPGFDAATVLRLAASVERGSSHPLAAPVLREADERGLAPPPASGLVETAGRGIRGTVEGREVLVGSSAWVLAEVPGARAGLEELAPSNEAGLRAAVVVQGAAAGSIEFADRTRPGIPEMLVALRQAGIDRVVLLSGDATANVAATAADLGIAEAHGDLLPGDKTAWVDRLQRAKHQVLMLGDGVNDAPALAAASVGVALSRGHSGITSSAADIVLTSDDPTRLIDAMRIARHTLGIARQSIWAGLGLSGTAMLLAGTGFITPVAGALLQEVIDVAVILNALRAARPRPPA